MILTQILQKIKSVVYTKSQIDSMGGGTSLDTTIKSKQNALSTAQLSAVNSGITSNKVSQYDEYINGASGQPVGTISWVMGSTVPAGYLICNGSAVSRTAYDKLFQAIGTKYGEGDGSTTFNLPNLIDRFLQGSETSGTIKDAGLPNIRGKANGAIDVYSVKSTKNGVFSNSVYLAKTQTQNSTAEEGDDWVYNLDFDASKSNSIYGNSDTVQPPSVTSIPCIKAFDSVIDATTVSVAQLSDTKVNKAGDTMTGPLTAPSFITNGIDCSVDSQGDGWIRYNSGLQICWTYLNDMIDSTCTWSFPRTFSQNPVITATVVYRGTDNFNQYQRCVELNNISNTSVLLRAALHTFTNTEYVVAHDAFSAIAIGRWK